LGGQSVYSRRPPITREGSFGRDRIAAWNPDSTDSAAPFPTPRPFGHADVIEFEPAGTGRSGIPLKGRQGLWRPFPIEYKRSRDKAGSKAYQTQLCAQALCLEEMFSIEIPAGAIYDCASKRRSAVAFSRELREQVESLAARMHELFAARKTPAPIWTKACKGCSLYNDCHPEVLAAACSIERYIRRSIAE
jgi:CRISPR-associated exonuclease Cas4